MKKHEIIKKAYDDYPKGTVFTWGGDPITSTGVFEFINDKLVCLTDDFCYDVFDPRAGIKWAEIVKPKIAIKVENEKEFKHLEAYLKAAHNDSVEFPCYVYPDEKRKYLTWSRENCHPDYIKDYQIISFQDFAKEKGIKTPLLVSEDGVDLYEVSEYHSVWKHSEGKWIYDDVYHNFKDSNPTIFLKEWDDYKAFSTKQDALDWIEAQKPKNIVISPDSGYPIIVYSKPVCGNEYIHLDMSKRGDYNGANIHLTIDELREAVNAYDSLHS